MLKLGKFKITAITRAGSPNKIPGGVQIKTVDYDDPSSLIEAFKGHDALIVTMSPMAPPGQHAKVLEAAAAANVPWILPNEWGTDGLHEESGKDNFLGAAKKGDRDLIEKLGKSSWIGVACGFWYEFSLGGGTSRYGFDVKNQTVTFFDDGTTRLNTSTWPQTGRAAAKLLNLKILPDDENDKSPCLANYRNTFVYASSFTVNQKEMFESLLRVTGSSPDNWKISYRPVKEIYQEGVKELQSGKLEGFVKLLYSRMFFPDHAGLFEETRGHLDNDNLGLPKEDLDEYTKEAIRLAESGYFDMTGH